MQLSVFHTGVRLRPSAPSHVSVPLMAAHISLFPLHCGFNGVMGKILWFFFFPVCMQFRLFAVNAGTWAVSLSLPVIYRRRQNYVYAGVFLAKNAGSQAHLWRSYCWDLGHCNARCCGLLLCSASLWVHHTVSTQGHYALRSQSFPSLSSRKGRWH